MLIALLMRLQYLRVPIMQLQYLRVLAKFLAMRLELKHSAVLIIFATKQRTKHHFVLKAKSHDFAPKVF